MPDPDPRLLAELRRLILQDLRLSRADADLARRLQAMDHEPGRADCGSAPTKPHHAADGGALH